MCSDPHALNPVWTVRSENIHSGDPMRYRVPGDETVRVPNPGVRVECGYVIQQFVIDSAGDIWDYEMLDVAPDERLAGSALRAIAGFDDRAAETNPDRTPLRVRVMTTFARDGGNACDWPEVDDRAPRQQPD